MRQLLMLVRQGEIERERRPLGKSVPQFEMEFHTGSANQNGEISLHSNNNRFLEGGGPGKVLIKKSCISMVV